MIGPQLHMITAARSIVTLKTMTPLNKNDSSVFNNWPNALASAKNCKQPGSDGVVAEMVRALSCTTQLWLYFLFLVRLGGWETEKLEAWNDVILTAIPKKTDKVGLQSMRYIILLLVL